MPSFAYEVKSELVNVLNYSRCCDTAQLNAMLKVGAEINGNRIDFTSTNAAVARKVLKLVKLLYKDVKTEVAVIRNKKFRIINRYVVRIFLDTQNAPLFKAMQTNKFPLEEHCQNAYLRGLFLACGSVNRPESAYHLEIFTSSEANAKFIMKNMKKLGFSANYFERQDKFIVYMKSFDMICDFLYLIKADNAVERLEVAQNVKEVRINVNRIINCETANLQRSINAAQKQIKDIRIVKELGLPLNDNLKEVADIRLSNPDASIPELANKIFISPSCFKHRMFKIHLMANPKERYRYNQKMKKKKLKALLQKEQKQLESEQQQLKREQSLIDSQNINSKLTDSNHIDNN